MSGRVRRDTLNHWRYFLSLEREFNDSLRYVEYTSAQQLNRDVMRPTLHADLSRYGGREVWRARASRSNVPRPSSGSESDTESPRRGRHRPGPATALHPLKRRDSKCPPADVVLVRLLLHARTA